MIKKNGRIVYIEPTEFAEYKLKKEYNTDIELDNISWNPEDLQYTVDLQVICPDRYNSNSEMKRNTTLTGSKSNEWASFMQGKDFNVGSESSNFLTDAYTEITYQEITNGGEGVKEALGINSIDINFDSHFFPLVTIKFTDVRAAALFGPTDNGYVQNQRIMAAKERIEKNGENEEDKKIIEDASNKASCSFFKSLFHFPYPRFMLSIMGFYGEKITFQLAVNTFKTNFNSTNGNFDVTVTFIGYMYGLYTDLPMSLIITAPYYNESYWNSMTGSTFQYNEGQPIKKFVEFINAYYELKKDSSINNQELKNYKTLIDKKNLLNNILSKYEYFDAQFTESNTNRFTIGDNPKFFALFYKESGYTINSNIFNELEKDVNMYNSKYTTSSSEKININIFSQYNKRSDIPFITILENKINKNENEKSSEYIKLIDTLNDIKTSLSGIKKDGKYISKYHIYNRGDFYEDVKKKIDKITDEINSKQESIDDDMLNIVNEKLGFKPTIENIYRMIFAHIETFFDSFEKYVENNIGKRTVGELKLTSKNSDISVKANNETNVDPFPLCKDKDGNIQFPGDFYEANVRNIVEVNYINKIVNGIETFNNEISGAISKIEESSNTEIGNFSPVTVNDIYYNGVNPYFVLKSKLKDEQTDDKKAAVIEEFILYRLIMDTFSNGEKTLNINDKSCKELLKLEFDNLQKSGIQISDNVKKMLSDNNLHIDSKRYDKENNKFLLNNVYFSYNPFIEDNSDDKHFTESNLLTIIDDRYNNGIKNLDEKITKSDVIDLRKYFGKIGGQDEYTISYITEAKTDRKTDVKTKEDIGYLGNLDKKEWNFSKMYVDYQANGLDSLQNYQAGTLQVLLPYTKNDDKKNEYIDDLYLGHNNDGDCKIKISESQNIYFRAFMFLGAISSYFSPKEINYLYATRNGGYGTNSNSSLFKYPKAYFLYLGACVFFQRYGFELTDIILSDDIRNILKEYTNNGISQSPNSPDIYRVNTFTKYDNVFLSNSNAYKPFKIYLPDEALNSLEKYFINWAENEFKTIDVLFLDKNYSQNKVITEKINNSVYHRCDTNFMIRESSSPQDMNIKTLLCDDIYVYKRPDRIESIDIYNIGTFKTLLCNLFKDFKTSDEIREEERKNEEKDTSEKIDLKKSLYYTLKRLYDKWLACYKVQGIQEYPFKLNEPLEDKNKRRIRQTTNSDNSKIDSEFDSFIFVDSFFRDISDTFLVNPEIFVNLIKSYSAKEIINSNASVFEFMNEIAEKNGLLFASIPVYNNFYDVNSIENIFTPHKKGNIDNSNRYKIPGNTYMIMYTGEASSKLDFGDDSEYSDDGIKDICGVSENIVPTELKDLFSNETRDDKIDYIIPVFGVTYAKQNQMYFKNILVNMDNPKVTDYSIANLIQISYGGAHGDSDGYNVGIGQDIFSIYANRSYTCTVEMMGCINIMPMMYFQLNNIPMFRGLYIIINVSHSIIPGNITTKFTGVRVSKNHIGLVKSIFNFQSLADKIEGNIINDIESVTTYCPTYEDESIGKGYFKLSDFLNSDTAKKRNLCNVPVGAYGITLDVLKERANDICINLLDPLYEDYKKKTGNIFYINSGLRTKVLNDAIGGSETSAHLTCYAVDLIPKTIGPKNKPDIKEFKAFVYYWLINHKDRKFDQFIDESNYSPGWVHLGYKNQNGKQRGEMFWTINGGKSYNRIKEYGDDDWVNTNYLPYKDKVT